jgi:glycerol-3-phosphate O-acyltransferase / dihydroxyacetone phosphate acyltransferase
VGRQGPSSQRLRYNYELVSRCIAFRDISFHVSFCSLISLFSPTGSATTDSELHKRTVTSLLAYSGLLHYTNLHHESLPAIIPRSRVHAIGAFFSHLFRTILHPKFILFLPALVVHIPAYISSNLAARLLATPELPETIALSKVVGGGLGIGVGYACATAALVRTLFRLGLGTT